MEKIEFREIETDGDSFEKRRALNQSLTFEAAEKEFTLRNVSFGVAQMKTLGIIGADAIYSNLGYLLSDQCTHTIKAAVFEGTDSFVFKNRREFTGSLFKQMEEVYTYIDFYNQTHSTFDKLLRIDSRDYPEAAIREALLNCIVHRDYALSASTLISIFADRTEFTSLGGLVPGITLEDVFMGISACRNKKLADVFYRLELIEAYGTGIRKIMKTYENSPVQPRIELSENVFKLILPNRNTRTESVDSSLLKKVEPTDSDPEKTITQFVQRYNRITRKQAEALLNLGQTSAGQILRRMVEEGKLVQSGKARATAYIQPQRS